MIDFLLPVTDRAVFLQFLTVATLGAAVLYLVRRRRELVVFVSGLWLVVIALMALRAVH